MWNAAVTAGNKLVTTGTTWSRFQGAEDLNDLEKKSCPVLFGQIWP